MGRSLRLDLDAGCTHQTYLGSGPTPSVKRLYPAWRQLTLLRPIQLPDLHATKELQQNRPHTCPGTLPVTQGLSFLLSPCILCPFITTHHKAALISCLSLPLAPLLSQDCLFQG